MIKGFKDSRVPGFEERRSRKKAIGFFEGIYGSWAP